MTMMVNATDEVTKQTQPKRLRTNPMANPIEIIPMNRKTNGLDVKKDVRFMGYVENIEIRLFSREDMG